MPLDKHNPKKTIVMDRYELIQEFNKTIIEIYSEENLQCLSGYFKGKPFDERYYDITTKCKINYNSKFDYTKLFDDLILCSDEILYFTAQLFLYRPLLLNPKGRFQKVNEFSKSCVRFSNIETLEEKRYYMLIDIVYQKIYNFWDRIGDLIETFFPNNLPPNKVFFDSALGIIPKEFYTIEEYIWLVKFKKEKYNILNKERIQIVHYRTTGTKFKIDFLEDTGNVQKWIFDRQNIAHYFKEQIEYTINGFEYTLIFLEKISNVIFADNYKMTKDF